jgi:hypothetical protein
MLHVLNVGSHGWDVRVTSRNGKRNHIPGFVSQQEAERWIEGKGPA